MKTLMNISKGASNTASTSAALGTGLNAFFSDSIPITGITLKRCCTCNMIDIAKASEDFCS